MSKVSEWVEQRELVAESGTVDQVRVTLRISGTALERLKEVAEWLDLTRTACGEELLERAIDDAFEQLDLFFKLSPEDLARCGWRRADQAEPAVSPAESQEGVAA